MNQNQRDYQQNVLLDKSRTYVHEPVTTANDRLSACFGYVFLGVLTAGLAGWAGVESIAFVKQWFWAIVIGYFAALFGFMFFKNIGTYLLFTSLSGVVTSLMVAAFIAKGMGHLVFQALLGTGVVTGGLTIYAKTSRQDFTLLGPALFWITLGLLVVMVSNIFFASSALSVLISCAALLIFSLWMLHDVQAVRDGKVDPLDGAMNIYLDVLNLFVNLLKLLGDLELND